MQVPLKHEDLDFRDLSFSDFDKTILEDEFNSSSVFDPIFLKIRGPTSTQTRFFLKILEMRIDVS